VSHRSFVSHNPRGESIDALLFERKHWREGDVLFR
jgi:hypothetical protein